MQLLELGTAAQLDCDGDYRLRAEGVEASVRYRKGTKAGLVVIFHGAVNRKTRLLPWFQSFLPNVGGFHQLAICDATLELSGTLVAGWYAGGESFPFQSALVGMIAQVSETLGARRRIYVGGSAGGFSALYCSFYDRDSVCVAVNPQVNLKTYLHSATSAWLAAAWPGARTMDEIEDKVCLDLGQLYAGGFENFVIYLQSSGDSRHFGGQLPDFFRAAVKSVDRFILECSYHGVPGHSASVPPPVYYPWVHVAAIAPTIDKQILLDTHFRISTAVGSDPTTSGEAMVVERTRGRATGFDAKDLLKSDLLRDLQLGRLV